MEETSSLISGEERLTVVSITAHSESAICLTLYSFIDVADLEGNTQAIKRFINQDNEEDVNLDNSVFMNFVRYNRSSIEACFQTDWKNSVMDHII